MLFIEVTWRHNFAVLFLGSPHRGPPLGVLQTRAPRRRGPHCPHHQTGDARPGGVPEYLYGTMQHGRR